MASVGALLMGRRSYEVVKTLGGWYYGETPVLVATSRPLGDPIAPTVSAVSERRASCSRRPGRSPASVTSTWTAAR